MENIENPQNQSKNSLFKDKGALTLDRLTVEVVGREDEAGRLSDVLGSTKLGYLPKVISVFGPPGSGKTLVTHRVCSDYVHSAPDFKFVYVNLGEVRNLFSVANRLLTALGGKPLLPRAGLDGVMEEFWSVVRGMGPGVKFLLLCLDEADRLFHDRRGDPSGFMYGLVRSEDRLEGLGVHLSLLTISNMIVWDYWELDGRVRSSMGTEEILFPPYEKDDLKRIVEGGCEEAFKPGVVDGEVIEECIDYASGQSRDVRRMVDLLRIAGEIAESSNSDRLKAGHFRQAIDRVEADHLEELLNRLPIIQISILSILASMKKKGLSIMSTSMIYDAFQQLASGKSTLSYRRVAGILNELEVMDLIGGRTVSKGSEGYGKGIWLKIPAEKTLAYIKRKWRESDN